MSGTRWCKPCTKHMLVVTTDEGYICCTGCGRVIDQDLYSNEPSFTKNSAGQSQLAGNFVNTVQNENRVSRERTLNRGVKAQHEVDDVGDESRKANYTEIEGNELESFSDIDDDEVAGYLHNEEEQRYKKIIWEKINWEYLEEQAAKEAEAAAREAMMAKFENGSAEALDAKKLVDEAAANHAKLKKGRQQKRAAEAKNPQTAAEAAHQMLSKKRISSRLNPDRLKELFDEPVIPDNLKKSRSDPNLE